MTARQAAWQRAATEAARAGSPAAALFILIAQPSEAERGHVCASHATGFKRDGRRGIKCAIDGSILRWIDR